MSLPDAIVDRIAKAKERIHEAKLIIAGEFGLTFPDHRYIPGLDAAEKQMIDFEHFADCMELIANEVQSTDRVDLSITTEMDIDDFQISYENNLGTIVPNKKRGRPKR